LGIWVFGYLGEGGDSLVRFVKRQTDVPRPRYGQGYGALLCMCMNTCRTEQTGLQGNEVDGSLGSEAIVDSANNSHVRAGPFGNEVFALLPLGALFLRLP